MVGIVPSMVGSVPSMVGIVPSMVGIAAMPTRMHPADRHVGPVDVQLDGSPRLHFLEPPEEGLTALDGRPFERDDAVPDLDGVGVAFDSCDLEPLQLRLAFHLQQMWVEGAYGPGRGWGLLCWGARAICPVAQRGRTGARGHTRGV